MKRIVKIVLISLASIVGLVVIAISIALNFIFTTEKLTPAVNAALKEVVADGKAEIGSVELTFFSSFPNFSLVMDSVVILDSSSVALLNLRKASLDVNPVAYLTKKAIIISDLTLNTPIINVNFDSTGISNIDIFKISTPDTTATDTTQTDIKELIKSIDVRKIGIIDGDITIIDGRNGSISSLKGLNFTLKGKLSEANANLMIALKAQSINIEVEERKLLSNFSFDINTNMRFNKDSLMLHTQNADVTIGNIKLSTSGDIQIDTLEKRLICDLNFGLATPSLHTLIGYIPQSVLKPDHRFSAEGNVELTGTIKGFYGDNTIPTIEARTTIKGGQFKFDKMQYGVQKLETDIALKIDGTNKSNSFIDVQNFEIASDAGVSVAMKGKITNILGNYNTQFDITSKVNLDRVTEIFPLADGIVVKGSNTTALKGKFTKRIIDNRDFGSIYLDGKSDFDHLLITIDGSKLADSTNNSYLYVEMKNGSFNFGNNSKVAKITKGEANLAASINFSGVGFRDKDGVGVFLSNVDLSAAAQVRKDSNSITPMVGELALGKIDFTITDTLEAHLTSSKATIKIEPSQQNKTKAHIGLSLRTDSIDFNAIHSKTNASLRVASLKLNIDSDSTISTKYSLNGDIGFGGFKAFSQHFPLDVSMRASSISFRNSRIELRKTGVRVGDSNVILTGWIENFIGNILQTSTKDIKSNLTISSDNIDLAQLYAASLKAASNSDTTKVVVKEQAKLADTTEAMQILLIPKNISSNLSLNVKKISFRELKVENIVGNMEVKNGAMTLQNFDFFAAGAKMNVAGTYHPLTDSLATAIFNLNAKKIVIKELVNFIPAIDSIMPVLKSFDGTINFDMAARTDIDQNMSIALPSLESVMSLSGTDLVLMDGETFRQISKMLLFKNKEKNTIDSLGVNIVVHKGGVINVPPFEVEIDRYRAIVGGTQTLDFKNFDINYAYNVSIIKSPLPIKAGVDIKGKNGDFDYNITKAKLKRSDFTEIQTDVDSIRNSILKLKN